MAKRKGNPNWGKRITTPLPVCESNFDRKCRELGLSENDFTKSAVLKRWVMRFGGTRYVPEWLLRSWGLEVISGSEGGYLGVQLVKQRELKVRVGCRLRSVASTTAS